MHHAIPSHLDQSQYMEAEMIQVHIQDKLILDGS